MLPLCFPAKRTPTVIGCMPFLALAPSVSSAQVTCCMGFQYGHSDAEHIATSFGMLQFLIVEGSGMKQSESKTLKEAIQWILGSLQLVYLCACSGLCFWAVKRALNDLEPRSTYPSSAYMLPISLRLLGAPLSQPCGGLVRKKSGPRGCGVGSFASSQIPEVPFVSLNSKPNTFSLFVG